MNEPLKRYGNAARNILAGGIFIPIPIRDCSKTPALKDWTNITIDEATVEGFASNGYAAHGIGHRCGKVGGLDVDIVDKELGQLVRAHVTRNFFDGKEPPVRFGNRPKYLIPCYLEGISTKVSSPTYVDNRGRGHKIEVLAKGQQFLLYGRHPDTQREYEWEGGHPDDIFIDVPTLTSGQVDELFEFLDEEMDKRGWKRAHAAHRAHHAIEVSEGDGGVFENFSNLQLPSASVPQLKNLLSGLSPRRCDDYDEWVKILGIISFETGGSEEGLELADRWSRQSDNYGNVERTFRSFKHDQATRQVATVASLIRMYKEDNNGRLPDSEPPHGEADSEIGWPEPTRIEPPRHRVRAITPEMIPEGFRDWVTDSAERMQCPPDHIAASLVVVCGSLIGTGCSIRPKQKDDWTVVPNLWGVIVGPPAQLKTPAQQEVINATLGKLEARAREQHELARTIYEVAQITVQERRKAIQKDIAVAARKEREGTSHCNDFARLEEELRTLQSNKEPTEKRYKTNDASVEKIVELLGLNPRGLLYYRDELIGLFKRMEKPGNEQDRAFLLEAWNGSGSHVDDRIGRGTVRCDNLCLSLLGSTQPDRLMGYLRGAISDGTNDGFVQRLQVMVYPDPVHWDYIDRKPYQKARDRAYTIVERLSAMEMDPGRNYLRFSDEAQKVFVQWLTYWQTEKIIDNDLHPVIQEHLAKYRSLVPSLALIFHLVDLADKNQLRHIAKKSGAHDEENRCEQSSQEFHELTDNCDCDINCEQEREMPQIPDQPYDSVSIHAVQRAIQWSEYLESHAHRIYSLALDTEHVAASALADKIIEGKLGTEFRRHQVVSKKWGGLTGKNQVQEAIEMLIEYGWLRVKSIDSDGKMVGRPSATVYQVNPKIISKHGEGDA